MVSPVPGPVPGPVSEPVSEPVSVDRKAVVAAVRRQEREARDGWDTRFLNEKWGHWWSKPSQLVSVGFHRVVDDPATVPVWHADADQTNYGPRVDVFVSGDESVLGTCLTVQPAPDGKVAHVTVVDARITAQRVVDLVVRILAITNGSTVVDVRRVYGVVAGVVLAWPQRVPRQPDMLSLGRDAPAPVRKVAGVACAVEIAGGTLLIAMIEPEVARRILDDDRARDHPYEIRASQCTALRRACADVWGAIERGGSGIGSGATMRRRSILLCAQHGCEAGIAFQRVDDTDQELALYAGVPITQVFARAHAALADITCGDRIMGTEVLDVDDMVNETRCRAERANASRVIRTIVTSDRCLRTIKKRIWRPSGRLARRMVAENLE